MEQENSQKGSAGSDAKRASTLTSYDAPGDGNPFGQQHFPALQQDSQASQGFPALGLPGSVMNQMPVYPARFLYQYYVPPATIPRSAFDCGMFTNLNPSEASADYRSREKRRRSRTVFSQEQLFVLEAGFQEKHYPDNKLRQAIAAEAGLPEDRVQVWFQNRRAKEKRLMEDKLVAEQEGRETENTTAERSNAETLTAIRSLVNNTEVNGTAQEQNRLVVEEHTNNITNDHMGEASTSFVLIDSQPSITPVVITTCTATPTTTATGIDISQNEDTSKYMLTNLDNSKFVFAGLSDSIAAHSTVSAASASAENLPKYIFENFSGNAVQLGTEVADHVVVLGSGSQFTAGTTELLGNSTLACTSGDLECEGGQTEHNESTTAEEIERPTT